METESKPGGAKSAFRISTVLKLHSLSADLHVGFPFLLWRICFSEYFSGIFGGGVKNAVEIQT